MINKRHPNNAESINRVSMILRYARTLRHFIVYPLRFYQMSMCWAQTVGKSRVLHLKTRPGEKQKETQ